MRRFLFLVTIFTVMCTAMATAASAPSKATSLASGSVSVTRAVSAWSGGTASATPTLSVSSQLDSRRYAAAGDRAYELGTEDGRYPAMGFHTRGEMGGIWTPPIKLLDGIWFGINGQWIGPATTFTSGFGYVQMALPATGGVQLTRTDFAPDGRRAVEFGLTLTAGSQAANVNLNVDAHSELMSAYPWGFTTPDQTTFNLPDKASFNGKQLVFTETGTPPVANASPHDWAAIVGATGLTPASGQTGTDFRGPQDPPVICPVGSQPDKFRCDDTAYGKGAGGELTYPVSVPAGASRTVWFTVAGSDQGLSDAQAQFQAASANPAAELAAKIAARQQLNSQTQVSLPGDPALAQSVTWSKQDMADLTQQADNLKIRDTEEGTAVPGAAGDRAEHPVRGRGLPRLPVDVRHRPGVHGLRPARRRAVRHGRGRHALAGPGEHHRQPRLGQGGARDRHRRLGLLRPERRAGRHRRDRQVPRRRGHDLALDRRQRLPGRDVRRSPRRTCST